jgi:hypothetical protein
LLYDWRDKKMMAMKFSGLILLSLALTACEYTQERKAKILPMGYSTSVPAQQQVRGNDCGEGFDQVMSKLEGEMAQPPAL